MRVLLSTILLAGAPLMAFGADNSKKPTGPLSPLEEKLQGTWKTGYTIKIDGREFCADAQSGEWYEGYVVIRPDEEPAQFDFVIEECACGFKGKTSKGILNLEGEAVAVVSAIPGEARPKDFEVEEDEKLVQLEFKAGGKSQPPGEHCESWTPGAGMRFNLDWED